MRAWTRASLLAALVASGGCGDPEGPLDADASLDAGPATDARTEPPRDTGPDRDAGPDRADAAPSDAATGDPCEGLACGMNARCVVADGGAASCQCIPGFEEVDGACALRAVECVVDQNCGVEGICDDGVCTCRSGRVGDGFTCSALASCRGDVDACDPTASCVDTAAGTACVCPAGRRGDGTACRDAGFARIWAGASSTCGLRTDGVASCWGLRGFGTTRLRVFAIYPADEPRGLAWTDLGDGSRGGCAIREDRTLWCGVDWDEPVGVGTDWAEVVAWGPSWCAIATDGGLHCWGDNPHSRLGLGSGVARVDDPTRVGTATWTHVTLAEQHGCGIRTDGTLWCWGTNTWGQMGPTASDVPIQVGAEADWESVTSIRPTTCGLRAGGQLWCWGSPDTSGTPLRVGSDTWRDVSLGGGRLCGVRADGTVWCRGTSSWGAHGSDEPALADFEQVGVETDWRRVSVGADHTCALREDGSAWCFGSNQDAELGIGALRFQRYPTRADAPGAWVDVASGEDFTCAIRDDGRLACAGQVRAAVEGARRQPSFVEVGIETWIDVAASVTDVCAIRSDRTLHCGPGRDVGGTFAFEQVGSATDWQSLFFRSGTHCGIRASGDLYCWGDPRPGFHDGSTFFSEPTLVTRGGGGPWRMVSYHFFHAVGLRADGTLWDFDLDTPIGADSDWRLVSVGYDDVCALKTDDSLWCWEEASPTPVRVGTERWADVEVHIRTACGARLDGTLWCWGSDTGAGETGTGVIGGSYSSPTLVSDVTGWTRVDRGVQTSFGLHRSGSLWAWGLNTEGELGTGTAWSTTPRRIRDVTR